VTQVVDSIQSEGDMNESPERTFIVLDNQIVFLDKIVTRIGRSLDNDVVIRNMNVSRYHAQIRYEGGSCVLYDLSSTLGTFVGEQKIDRWVLKSGDVFTLANMRVLFVQNTEDEIVEESKSETRELQEKLSSLLDMDVEIPDP
jgi:pSer/pThr/pTyr-binding forkhead associated (FHA) protein